MPSPPDAQRSLLAGPLCWLTRQIVRFPLVTLLLAGGFGVAGVVLAASRLEFHTSRLDLLNPDSSYNKLWIQYIEQFGDKDDVVLVVEGESAAAVTPAIDELAEVLRQESQRYEAVLAKVDLATIRSKGLHYVPPQELQNIDRLLDSAQPVLAGDWNGLSLEARFEDWNRELEAARQGGVATPKPLAADIESLISSLQTALTGGGYHSVLPALPAELEEIQSNQPHYLLANEGRLGFVLLHLTDADVAQQGTGLAAGSEAIDHLREIVAAAQERHPELKIGLTGLPVMENDEMRSSQNDSLRASGISLVGVALLFIVGMGGVRHPLLTVLALLIAIAWTLGYLTWSVGHLNILSVSFGVILIGLGIDFGIHYVSRYQHLLAETRDSGEALAQAAASIGPGVLTGGVTTALAFFAAGLTQFTGLAELGIISGGGILLCVLAALVVLPALIQLTDRHREHDRTPEPLEVHHWVKPAMALPRLTLLAAIAGTAALGYGWMGLRYDHNLLNLQPEGLESVALEERLLSHTDQSVWYALSTSPSREELLARKEKFLELPTVDRVEEVATLLPDDDPTRNAAVQAISKRLSGLPAHAPQLVVAGPAELAFQLKTTEELLAESGDLQAESLVATLSKIRRALRQNPETSIAALGAYQQQMVDDLVGRLQLLKSLANPLPPVAADLPPSLAQRFIGRSGTHLMKIYGRGNIWDMEHLEAFVLDVKRVDPAATGKPLQTYYASLHMLRSYLEAAAYALIAVLVVLMLDLRSIRDSLLALVPMSMGLAQMFGLLGLLDVPLNPANMIVLPLILGIGIDDGVHVIHDFRRQKGLYRISPSTATSVLLTSLTTMVGFGSLMLAHHAGLRSLGLVLTLGVSCCLVSSLVVLPSWLRWRSLLREKRAVRQAARADERPGAVVAKPKKSTATSTATTTDSAAHATAVAGGSGATSGPIRPAAATPGAETQPAAVKPKAPQPVAPPHVKSKPLPATEPQRRKDSGGSPKPAPLLVPRRRRTLSPPPE